MYKKIFLILTTFLFICSALEIEIGGVEQTFCDAYDTYIPAKPAKVKKTQPDSSKAKKAELKKHELKKFGLNSIFYKKVNLSYSNIAYNRFQSPYLSCPILLRKSELRI